MGCLFDLNMLPKQEYNGTGPPSPIVVNFGFGEVSP
jgi:hypothetical protein